jgi:hypothetical protein
LAVFDSAGNLLDYLVRDVMPSDPYSAYVTFPSGITYSGNAYLLIEDQTAGKISNQWFVAIAQPSPCTLGNKACRTLNAVPYWPTRRIHNLGSRYPFLRRRLGRFYYLDPPRSQ